MRKTFAAAVTAALAAIMLATAPSARADVKLPAILSDNMCLQANHALSIWGQADPGEAVTVTLRDQKQSATADQTGNWRVTLAAMPAASAPMEMQVAGKNSSLTIRNIVIGEVWVASGQSNMEFGFRGAHNNAEETPKANYPKIRIFNLHKKIAFEPQWDCQGKWEECTPQTVQNTSAVGYFFVRDLHQKLGVPMGLIHTSWGGTPAEAWTSLEGLAANPELKGFADRFVKTRDSLAAEKERYEKELMPRWQEADKQWKETTGAQYAQAMKRWQAEVKTAQAAGQAPPPQPRPASQEPRRPSAPDQNPNLPTVLYNGMIAPIVPFAIQGAIWYQGESNAGNPWQYRTLFPAMITDWRKSWSAINADQKEFPFLFVQLANFMARQPEPVQDDGGWPGLREAQHMTLSLPNTGEAVIIDVGQADDIHPRDKMDVGRRLALGALKVAYHQEGVVYSGPTYKSMTAEGSRIRVRMDNVGGGLTIAAAPSTQPGVPQAQAASQIKGFTIAGEDKKFVWANAKVEGDSIVVWSDQVSAPVAVRYAWANNPECNLYNKDGLPASPFRTDTWGKK
jgi:sialate O-acetylesterase